MEQSTCLVGWRLLYFFMSSSNFLIPRLIASARSHSSCLQYSLRILLEHPSNLTVIRSFLGLLVGRPVLGDICSILLPFVCHNLYYILCLPKVKRFFQNIFYPTYGIKKRANFSAPSFNQLSNNKSYLSITSCNPFCRIPSCSSFSSEISFTSLSISDKPVFIRQVYAFTLFRSVISPSSFSYLYFSS